MCCSLRISVRDLDADHRFDELVLLLGGRARLFGFDPLRLRLLLLLVGELELVSQLLAQPRDQQLGRQRHVTKLDLLDNDAGAQPFGTDCILDCVFQLRTVVGEVQNVTALGADDIADDRADRRDHDVVFDFL